MLSMCVCVQEAMSRASLIFVGVQGEGPRWLSYQPDACEYAHAGLTVLAQDLCYSDPPSKVLTFSIHTSAVMIPIRAPALASCACLGMP